MAKSLPQQIYEQARYGDQIFTATVFASLAATLPLAQQQNIMAALSLCGRHTAADYVPSDESLRRAGKHLLD